MARFFREPDRRQRYLLPVDMLDWLPEDDIVHLLVDAVALMDLSGFEAAYKPGFPIWIRPTCRKAVETLAKPRIPSFTRHVRQDSATWVTVRA